MDLSLFIFLILSIGTLTVSSLIYFIITLDSDLTLYFAEKFGKPISNLKGKVVWVTGASSGIGESLAYLLAKTGAKLIISGTNKERLNNVRLKCIAEGASENNILALDFDMKDFDDHPVMFKTVVDTFGKIDILVNNAGRSQRAAFEDIELRVDEEIFKINTLGPVSLARLALKHWNKTGKPGVLAVITSVAGKAGAPFSASYTGSKHALHGYFECLRVESINKPIKVVMCCPGPVESRILENAFTGDGERVGNKHPPDMKRMKADRCAKLIAVSIVNQLEETWMVTQPVLFFLYAAQYMPSITKSLMSLFFSPKSLLKFRDG